MKLTVFFFTVFLTVFAQAVPPERLLAIGEEIRKVYEPLARKDNAAFRLIWKSNETTTINASGIKKNGAWEVTVYGGLMLHPSMTEEAFRMILCHEIGHIVGGEPTFTVFSELDRGSNAGQPDYYAAAVCMKLLLKDVDNSTSKTVDPILDLQCRRSFNTRRELELCRRIGSAGQESITFLLTLNPTLKASYATPSRQVASKMNSGHPEPQCRLDTLLAGALCRTSPTGKSVDEGNQINASCNVGESARPRCWFVP